MKKKGSFFEIAALCMLIFCVSFAGCGVPNEQQKESTQNADNQDTDNAETESRSIVAETPSADELSAVQNEIDTSGKEVITLGTLGEVKDWEEMGKAVYEFNQAQDKYYLEIKVYDSYSKFTLDIVRKQGADIFDLSNIGADLFARKDILEDLTPYFESSETVSREDIVDAVWRAGSIDGKLFCLIPCFSCQGVLVEKGYTKNGAWTQEDYLSLGEQYPDSMLNSSIQRPDSQILMYLKWCMGSYINWDELTCDYESESFIALLEKLKTLSEKKYDVPDGTMAELIRDKLYLTQTVSISLETQMVGYKDIKDAFLDSYEIAGMPTGDGSLKYDMVYSQIYGMNAASSNKEGAWAFLEYLLSEEYQQPSSTDILSASSLIGGNFPARKDLLEQALQENIDYVPDSSGSVHYAVNRYTKETTTEYREFTEEDRESILNMIDNTYRESSATDYQLLFIIAEETKPFFEGQKSAEEAAKIIQSRVSIYLVE